MKLPARVLLSFGAGLLTVAALPPYGLWPLAFAGLGLFYALLGGTQTPLRVLLIGWCFGFGYFIAGLWWIANALLVSGNEEYLWVWPLAVAGLPALLAFFPALACAAAAKLSDLKRLPGFFAFVAALAAAEWLRGHIFTGLPWNLFGTIWIDWLAVAQIASVGGIYFLTLLTIFWTALPGFLFAAVAPRKHKIILCAIAALSFVGTFISGHLRQEQKTDFNSRVAVRPVQANIPQEDKWNPEKTASNLIKTLKLSAADPARDDDVTLIVWPETALTWDVLEQEAARSALRAILGGYKKQVYLLTGLLRHDTDAQGRDRYYNSLAVLDRDLKQVALYNKFHLVPFGEYIPFQKFIPLKPVTQFQGFATGPGPATLSVPGAPPFSPLVCYEVIFPGAVTAAGSPRPAWIANVTNDAWYGDSPGPRQHFAQARFRAIEEGLPVVRAADTGISGVIDPLGRIVYKADLGSTMARTVLLPQPLSGPTLYAQAGDWLFFLLLALCAAIALLPRKRA